ncbi:hypothetical protein DPMN_173040 [Dreissena polymorpha]|uniref:Uncharacterized protein n=1 Tax=Dreissena polymorpha TaxID=45954 RepID=A0A9D4IGL0_DREPO|nr:hypothetical protein DPMN_173040 [Dreissena polymorpha]
MLSVTSLSRKRLRYQEWAVNAGADEALKLNSQPTEVLAASVTYSVMKMRCQARKDAPR